MTHAFHGSAICIILLLKRCRAGIFFLSSQVRLNDKITMKKFISFCSVFVVFTSFARHTDTPAGSTAATSKNNAAIAEGKDQRLRAQLRETSKTVNVKSFGAEGDGTTNDLGAIQKAISAVSQSGGGIVHFPKGIYAINSSINIPSGIHLQGEGPTSEIRCTGSGIYPALKNQDFANGNNDITITNLTVNGYRAERGLGEDAGSHGIRIQSDDAHRCNRLIVKNVWVKNMPCAGMMFFNVKDVIVSNNKVSDTMRDGISTWCNSENVTYSNNLIWDVRDDCYGINSEVTGHSGTVSKQISITGGQLSHANDSHYGAGVRVAGAWDVKVRDVVISNTQGHGILVEGAFLTGNASKRVTISGCVVSAAGFNASVGGHGIAVANAVDCNIVSNVIQGYQLNGINISNLGKHVNITGNTVLGGVNNNGAGVNIDGENNLISKNTILLTKSYGIKVNGPSNTITGNDLNECSTATPGNAYILVSAGKSYNNIASNKIRRITSSYGTYGIRIAKGSGVGNSINANQLKGFEAGNGVSSGSSMDNPTSKNLDVP